MRWFLFRLAWSGLLLSLCVSSPCLAQDYLGTTGDDVMTVGSGETYDNVRGDAGDDTITNHGTVSDHVYGDDGDDTINNYGTISNNVFGNDGDDTITNWGKIGNINSGAGDDTIINHGRVNAIYSDAGNDVLTNTASGIISIFDGREGDDLLINYGTVSHTMRGGEDDDVLYNYGYVNGDYFDGYPGDDVLWNYGYVANHMDGDMGNDIMTNAASGHVGDDITGYEGDDLIYNYGTVVGSVSGGLGTDSLYLYGGASMGGIDTFETVYKLDEGSVTISGAMDMDGGTLFVDLHESATPFSVGSVAAATGNFNVTVKGGHWRNGQAVDLFSTGALNTWAAQNLTYTSGVLTLTLNSSQITAARGSYSQVVDPSHVNPNRLVPLLDSLAETTSGDWDNLFSALDFLPAGRMEDAISQLGPSLTGTMQGQALSGQHLLGAALAARPALGAGMNPGGFTLCVTGAGGAARDSGTVDMASVRAFNDGVARVFSGGDWDVDAMQAFAPGSALGQGAVLADALSGLSESEAMGPSLSLTSMNAGYWMRVLGGEEFNENHEGFPGSRAVTLGVAGGADFRLNEQWDWGLHAAFLRHNVELDDQGGSTAEAWSAHLGASAAYEDGPWSVDGSLDLFHVQWDTRREIVFGGLDRAAHADVTTNGVAASVNAAHEFHSGDWRLAPVAGLEFMYQHQDAYSESGAGALDLHVDAVDAASLRTRLGGRVTRDFEIETTGGGSLTLTPEFHALWLHEFLADSTDISCEFEGGGSFDSATPDPDRDSLLVGASLSLGRQDSPSLYLQGDTELSSHSVGYRAALGFRIPF